MHLNQEKKVMDIIGSIKNLFNSKKKINHWYKEDIWGHAKNRIKDLIEPGISIYAEIVGQTPQGTWIQKNYDYGTKPNEFEIYVYRITSTDAQGNVTEYTTNQVKSYCNRKGLKMVPIHYHGRAGSLNNQDPLPMDYGPDFHSNMLGYLVEKYLEKTCAMCKNNVPAEGVVVTVERDQFTPYKLKSFAFLEGETKALDNNDVGIESEEQQ